MQRIHEQDLHDIEKQLYDRFEKSTDFSNKDVLIANQKFRAYFVKTLVDLPTTLSSINQAASGNENESFLKMFSPFEEEASMSLDELCNNLLHGKLVLFSTKGLAAVIEPEHPGISRSVSSPESENPLQSAFDAFTEDIDKNIGLLRKKMISDQLVIESRETGVQSTKKIAMVYIEGVAQPKVIAAIRDKLEQNKDKELTTVRDLLSILGHPRFSITPTYISSELPGEMVQNMMNGKVVILIDQYSFAFAFPAIITDLWSTTLDVNYPYLFQVFLRTIRAIGALLAITLPGLYIVLNSVNPELLRIQLAITVAKSREGVPYPSLIEMLLVMLLLEMIIEATIRLPKNIGPTITMIGGILLGQAIVQAKLVSNLLIIILVASAIANFVLAGYMNTTGIRMYKYVVMIISSFFGIWGLEAAMIWIILYFSSLSSCSVPYLSLSVKGKAQDE
ncbi:spore germination protein [Paenibacillus sp. 276b]|uniref:spore germination protein n=1 Tax=Paenibacillus sp. 276b TaxID=1566277 RepID=UPI000897B847|nr:spore germination protein [Paenibacillus sp. 276b]SEA50149.1 GerA spore germination protein [Paenibacillus sp. 276b]